MNHFLITISLLAVSICTLAQQSRTVTGRVVEDGKPLEFVSVYLATESDTSKIVAGTVTDSVGRFNIANVHTGNFTLTAQMVGYKRLSKSLSLTSYPKDVGELELIPDPQMLNAVEVSALKNSIQKTEEGFVVNASANITQIGGTAADLLKNMLVFWLMPMGLLR